MEVDMAFSRQRDPACDGLLDPPENTDDDKLTI
jgi:hypothetical protein